MSGGPAYSPGDFDELLKVFERVLEEADVMIIGGQALNFWATQFYDNAPKELEQYAPFTSKDIDCRGSAEAAEVFARLLGGRHEVPAPGDHSPNTAIAWVPFRNGELRVDFLWDLSGVDRRILEGNLATVDLEWWIAGQTEPTVVRVLHPLPVLMSRAGNIVLLKRTDATARRQAAASVVVLREYLRDRLAAAREQDVDSRHEVVEIAKALLDWCDTIPARAIRDQHVCDPLDALDAVAQDSGWPEKYREMTLEPRLKRLRERLARAQAEAARKHRGRAQ